MEQVQSQSGRQLFVDRSEPVRGSKAFFFRAFESPDGENAYGWYCDSCATFDNAMDSMGRIQCNHCGNLRKPTEWDAAQE